VDLGGVSRPAAARLPLGRRRDGASALRAALARLERESIWAYVIAAYAMVLAVKLPVLVAPDTWLALVSGREIVEHGIPHHDSLTVWTAGAEWIDQQWLAQLALYGTVALGGLQLALALHVALLVASFAMLLIAARRLGASPRATAVGGALCLLATAGGTVLRAQTLAIPLFVALLWLLLSDIRNPSGRILLALPLVALWGNLHGTAVLAAGLVALRGIDSLRRRPAVGGALMLGAPAALLISPYGLSLVDYYAATIGNRSFSKFVTEWAPPAFPADWRLFALAGLALWLVSRYASLLTRYEKVVFVLLLLAALSANRHGLWLGLYCGIVMPRLIDAAWRARESPPPRRLVAGTWAVIGVMFAMLVVPAFTRDSAWYTQRYPAQAAASVAGILEAEPSARVFSSEVLADWLLWEVPSAKGRIAFDVRFELLSQEQLVHMSEFVNAAEGWRPLLRGYRVAVLEPARLKRNVRALLADGSAVKLFEDDRVTVLLLRERRR
jgi:hypothetical protein